MQLKIISWNIWQGKNLPEVLLLLKSCDADVIGLQEVSVKDGLNQAEILAREQGYEYFYGKAFKDDRHEGNYELGNAILSKYPIENPEVIPLSSLDDYKGNAETESRVAVKANIKIEDKILGVVCTHLGFSRTAELSPIRAVQLGNLMKVMKGENLVLMADLNSIPESEVIKKLDTVLRNTDQDLSKMTFKGRDQEKFRIDYIYASNDMQFSDFEILDSSASDHKPIQVLIDL